MEPSIIIHPGLFLIAALFVVIIFFSRFGKKMFMPRRGTPWFALEVEWPVNCSGSILLGGSELISFPLKRALIKKEGNLLVYRKRGYEHKCLIRLGPAEKIALRDRPLDIEICYESIASSMPVGKKGEVELKLAWIEKGELIATEELTEREFRMTGAGKQKFQFDDLYSLVKRYIKINPSLQSG